MAKDKKSTTPKRKYTRKLPTAKELNASLQKVLAENKAYRDKLEDLKDVSAKILALKNDLALKIAQIGKLQEQNEKAQVKNTELESRLATTNDTMSTYLEQKTALENRINNHNKSSWWTRVVTKGGKI
jgi:chromosome segregation ATPase